nr:hypothetical protein [Tanacetum cinerariifolium]
EEEKPVGPYFIKMKNYVAQLECLGYVLSQDLGVGLILNGLTSDFAGFVRNYNKHNMGKTIGELHALLIEYEKGLPKKAVTPQVMVIQCGRIQKANKKSLNAKGKEHPTRHRMTPVTTAKRWGIVFKYKVENQLEKTLKALRSDREDEYISQEFKDYLKACGIFQQLTRPYTPQHNGVSEIRNRTLLDMVQSMIDLTNLQLSFWDYALESAARILNMVPTNKRDTLDKLQQRSVKCIFIGYPKKTMGYYFYFPPVNKIVVARYTEFLEKNLISQEVSGRALELEEIQDEDTSPSENTSEIPVEVEGFKPPQEEVIPVGRKCFTMKDLGKTAFIFGIKIYQDRSKRLIRLSQSAYMDKILKRYRMDNSKRGNILMQKGLDLNKTQDASTAREVKHMQNVPYASAVCSIINPEVELRVDCYCNAGFETDRDETKSQTRYVFILNGMRNTKAVWIKKFIWRLGIVPTINEPIKMFWYNSTAHLIANEPRVHRGARHSHRRFHYVCKCIELGEINLLIVHTDEHLADPFTKALSNRKLTQHTRTMGLRLASSFM